MLGLLFLAAQTFNWIEFYGAIRRIEFSGAYLGMFYVLTGLHAAHVVGGLIPLVRGAEAGAAWEILTGLSSGGAVSGDILAFSGCGVAHPVLRDLLLRRPRRGRSKMGNGGGGQEHKARSKEQEARSKKQGARSKEQEARSKKTGIRLA